MEVRGSHIPRGKYLVKLPLNTFFCPIQGQNRLFIRLIYPAVQVLDTVRREKAAICLCKRLCIVHLFIGHLPGEET